MKLKHEHLSKIKRNTKPTIICEMIKILINKIENRKSFLAFNSTLMLILNNHSFKHSFSLPLSCFK